MSEFVRFSGRIVNLDHVVGADAPTSGSTRILLSDGTTVTVQVPIQEAYEKMLKARAGMIGIVEPDP